MRGCPLDDGNGGEPANRKGDVVQLVHLLAEIDVGRLRRHGLMKRCFDVLVPPERLCLAFARASLGSNWIDVTALGVALRRAFDFCHVDGVLQGAVWNALGANSARAPPFVSCCGCVHRPCAQRPCAHGWMRPIGERARLRLLAWQWSESSLLWAAPCLSSRTVVPLFAPHDTAHQRDCRTLLMENRFGGFYARELKQCTESETGDRTGCRSDCWLAACHSMRTVQADDGRETVSRSLCRPQASRSTEGLAESKIVSLPVNGPAVYARCDPCGLQSECVYRPAPLGPYDKPARTDAETQCDQPLVLFSGITHTVSVRDINVYNMALAHAHSAPHRSARHPSEPLLAMMWSSADRSAVHERWVVVKHDAYIVKARLRQAAPSAHWPTGTV